MIDFLNGTPAKIGCLGVVGYGANQEGEGEEIVEDSLALLCCEGLYFTHTVSKVVRCNNEIDF